MADERFRGKSEELAVRVLSAYSQALLAQERIELSRAQKRAFAERLQLNDRLLKGGEGTRTDVLETQARRASPRLKKSNPRTPRTAPCESWKPSSANRCRSKNWRR